MILHNIKSKGIFSGSMDTLEDLEKCLNNIRQAICTPVANLEVTAWCTKEPVAFKDRQSGVKRDLAVGDNWGELFDCAWCHFTGNVPQTAKGQKVVLLIDLSGEALVVDESGNPRGILTTGSTVYEPQLGNAGKTVLEFLEIAEGGESVDVWADAGNNDLFGNLQNNGTLQQACIATKEDEIEQLYYDFEVLFDLLGQLEEKSSRYHRILNALQKAHVTLTEFSVERVTQSRAFLAPELARQNGDYPLQVSAIGHAHIDLAWLWPIRETIRKGARTFANVMRMMERYPDYLFGASQPQLYQWMKEYYPSLYKEIKQKVAEGRWEPLGGMWVESDSNCVGGESLIRQFLYGKRFFQQEFDKELKNLFMPDTFGYSAALPQILKKCGVDYFITTKISWDRFNNYPHDTFKWQGIDGSEVLVHMPPEGTYNSSAAPRAIKQAEFKYSDKEVSENCLVVYGIGDGGGGPSIDHLERLKREKDLAGMAPVIQEPVAVFFKKLEQNIAEYKTWVGELYLGFHQGTYTTQARNKRGNRKMEIALRETEFLSVLAGLQGVAEYPRDQLETIWKETLLYQFHDILPGSSITRVHQESQARYEEMFKKTAVLTQSAIDFFAQHVNTSALKKPAVVWNSLSWERSNWLKIADKWQLVTVPACGYIVVEMSESVTQEKVLVATNTKLENELLALGFDDSGELVSVFDKENNREAIPAGQTGNRLNVYADAGDAWDFALEYPHRKVGAFNLEKSDAFIDGPRAVFRQERKFGKSTLKQEIVITAGSRRVDFVTSVDWQEEEKMLRAAFPLEIHANESTSEIQFGYIKRPTHRNTSWELSKYEISAHKWIDLSQPDYGVALLNDCKYGHWVHDNVLDINLLRSPLRPDPEADRGKHKFTYSLFPHVGDHLVGGVIRAGYELNVPLNAIQTKARRGSLDTSKSFVMIESAELSRPGDDSIDIQKKENVILESMKKAEDSEATILRLYEAFGMGGDVKITFGFDVKSVCETNMLEEKNTDVELDSNSISLEFKPFEIKTICVSA